MKYSITRSGDIVKKITPTDVSIILIREFYWGKVEVKYTKIGKDIENHFLDMYPDLVIKDGCAVIDYTDIFQQLGTFAPLISRRMFNLCRDIRE